MAKFVMIEPQFYPFTLWDEAQKNGIDQNN